MVSAAVVAAVRLGVRLLILRLLIRFAFRRLRFGVVPLIASSAVSHCVGFRLGSSAEPSPVRLDLRSATNPASVGFGAPATRGDAWYGASR